MRRRGLFPAGRLDKDTTGFLLITDDGELAHRMLSPKKHVYKRYAAWLDLPVTREDIELRKRRDVGGRVLRPCKAVDEGGPSTAFVEVREGRFHQVKRMFESRGKQVLALKRLKIGGLFLDETLQEGDCRSISQEEIRQIFQ